MLGDEVLVPISGIASVSQLAEGTAKLTREKLIVASARPDGLGIKRFDDIVRAGTDPAVTDLACVNLDTNREPVVIRVVAIDHAERDSGCFVRVLANPAIYRTCIRPPTPARRYSYGQARDR